MAWLASVFTPRVLFLSAVFTTINVLFIRAVQDPDFWWHIRTGQWIAEHFALPAHDIYTYTVSGHLWTDHEYLTEVLMWLAYSHFGIAPIVTGFAAVTWAAFWLMFRTADGARQPYVVVGLALALAAVAGAPIWGPRAQMITFFLSCLELMWLHSFLRGRSRAIVWFPLVMLVWANMHAGWVIGFAFLGLATTTEFVHFLRDRHDAAHRSRLKTLAIVAAVSAVAVAFTPHGLSLYLYPFHTQGSPAQQNLINEWASPNFHFTEMRFFELMLMLLIAGFALRRPSLFELLLSIAVLALALQSVRHVALFIAAVTPILIVTWSDVYRRHERAIRGRWQRSQAPASALLPVVAVATILLIAGATAYKAGNELERQDAVTRTQVPVGAANFLAAHPEIGTRMYNQYGWGGYLAYRFYPDPNRRVFIFGEGDLMGDSLLNQYEDVQTLRPDWSSILDRYHVDYVVYNRGEALDNVLASLPGWKKVYADDVAVVYVRASR